MAESRELCESLFGFITPGLKSVKESVLEIITGGRCFWISFELHFASDLKMLYSLTGLTSATSNFSCPWCTIPKDYRADDIVLLPSYLRSFSELSASSCLYCSNLCRTTDENGKTITIPCPDTDHGVKPVANLLFGLFEISNVWVDILHLTLRLSDRLEMFMKEIAEKSGKVAEMEKAFAQQCDIKYHHWTQDKVIKWPSLNADQKLVMLDRLTNLSGFIPDVSHRMGLATCIDQLRKVLAFLRCHVKHDKHEMCPHEVTTLPQLETLVKEMSKFAFSRIFPDHLAEIAWISLLGKASVTPYFHILESHIPKMILQSPFGSIAHFQLQGQEQIHQVHTRILFRASNWQGNKCYSVLEREISLLYLQNNPHIWQWVSKDPRRRKGKPIPLELLFLPKDHRPIRI